MKLFAGFGAIAGQVTGPSGTVGMETILASSISNSGGTATLGTNGLITFSGVATITLEGVFSSKYTNYLILWRGISSNGDLTYMRLRASGSDSATGYVDQYMLVNNITVTTNRTTQTNGFLISNGSSTYRIGSKIYLFSPNSAVDTHAKQLIIDDSSGIRFLEYNTVHEVETAYTGATFRTPSGSLTGTISIYGLVI